MSAAKNSTDEDADVFLQWAAAPFAAGWFLMLVCGNLHQHWAHIPAISFWEASTATWMLSLLVALVFTAKRVVGQ